MEEFRATIDAGKPIGLLEAIVKWLQLVGEDPLSIRENRSRQAARVAAKLQGTMTDAAILTVPRASQGTEVYSFLIIIFETTAGSGRYWTDGENPTAAGSGIQIPSGGAVIEIEGHEQIKNFKAIGETGQTLPFVWQLYR